MRFKTHLTVLLILIVAGAAALFFLGPNWFPFSDKQVSEDGVTVPAGQQLIKEPWVSFLVPKKTENTGFEVVMNVLQPLNIIEVNWSHPASGEEDRYLLRKYTPGGPQARYLVRNDLGNFLPGVNDYTITAIHPSPGIPDQTFQVSFSVEWDVSGLSEIHPEIISFPGLTATTDARELELSGKLSAPAATIQITSAHPKRGQASFRLLNKFSSGTKEFQYFAKIAYGNFYSGDNIYIVEALDDQKNILSRKQVIVQSTAKTVDDEIDGFFGRFKPLQDGWFVSSKLPWFSIRPVYDTLLFQKTRTDNNILLPRPTLMYTAQASKETSMCDYLKSLDYQATGVSYVGNSFETCQQYNFGVSVFDRFISPLSYKPFDVVRRIDYQGLTDKVSSAFLMIENGGMQERTQPVLSFEQMAEIANDKAEEGGDDAVKPEATEDVKPAPRFYLYQFLLSENIPLTEEKLPSIASEIPEAKKKLLEDIRAFLRMHSGDEIFTPLLFPTVDTSKNLDQDAAKVNADTQKE